MAQEELEEAVIQKLGKADLIKAVASLAGERKSLKERMEKDKENCDVHGMMKVQVQAKNTEIADLKNQKSTMEMDKNKKLANLHNQKDIMETDKNNQIANLKTQNNTIETKVNNLTRKVDTLSEDKNDLEARVFQLTHEKGGLIKELDTMQTLLYEKDNEKAQLLEEMMSNENENEESTETIKFLLVTHPSMEIIRNYLPKGIDWELKLVEKMIEFSDMTKNEAQKKVLGNYDKVVSILGTYDLKDGSPVFQPYNLLRQTIVDLKDSTQMCVIQIPPNMVTGAKTDIYNYKLPSLALDGAEVIEYSKEILLTPKEKILKEDKHSLNELGARMYGGLLSQIEIPKPGRRSQVVPDEMSVTEFMEVARTSIGRMIGAGGKNVREITEQTEVNITIGKFVETKKKGQETIKETSGSLITGKPSNILKAKKRIREVIESVTEKDSNKFKKY